jgi:hypothetical protein
MSIQEILIAILWIITGTWICYKRNWYRSEGRDDEIGCAIAIVAAPINLLVVFFRVFIISSWDN